MKRRFTIFRKLGATLAIFLMFVAVCCFAGVSRSKSVPAGGRVVEVFDGDTILLDTGEKVRYLGIDAPEMAHNGAPSDCYGPEAKHVNADWVLKKRVTLQYDQKTTDRYGRLLAYVLLPDGRCVNEEMLRSGHAFVLRVSKELSRFHGLLSQQREAIRSRRGMWGNCQVKTASFYIGNHRSFVFHRPDCTYGLKTSPRNRERFLTRWAALEEGYSPCRLCKP